MTTSPPDNCSPKPSPAGKWDLQRKGGYQSDLKADRYYTYNTFFCPRGTPGVPWGYPRGYPGGTPGVPQATWGYPGGTRGYPGGTYDTTDTKRKPFFCEKVLGGGGRTDEQRDKEISYYY